MEKFSVKKPYTILVAVIIALALGAVSVLRMTTELLPDFSIPYMLVITTYVGASPETVESAVTEPLESELGTISGVENVYSYSMENYSMIELEFEEDTDMDSALVKVSMAINDMDDSLPDAAGTPLIMELSMDMVATMYIGVGYEGYDQYELTDYVSDEVIPYLERQEGVASVSSVGLVEETVVVELNQDKIDELNEEILLVVNDELAEAKEALDDAEAQIDEALEEIEGAQETVAETISSSIFDALTPTVEEATDTLSDEIVSMQEQLNTLIDALEELRDADPDAELDELEAAVEEAAEDVATLISDLYAAITDAAEDAADSAVSAAFSSLSDDLDTIADDAVSGLTDIADDIMVDDAVEAALDAGTSSALEGIEEADPAAALEESLTSAQESAAASAQDLADAITSALESVLSDEVTDELDSAISSAVTAFVMSFVTFDEDGSFSLSEIEYDENGVPTLSEEQLAALTSLATQLQAASELLNTATSDAAEAAYTSVSDSLTDAQASALEQLTDLYETVTDILSTAAAEAVDAAVSSLSGDLSEDEIEELTDALMDGMSDAVSDAAVAAIDSAASSLSSAASTIISIVNSSDIAATIEEFSSDVDASVTDLSDEAGETLDSLIEKLNSLSTQLDSVTDASGEITDTMDSLETAYAALTQAQLAAAVELATYTIQLTEAQATLEEAQTAYDEQKEAALESANLDDLLTMSTLATLIYAQNFAMPAGYIDDEDSNSWLLKIGDEYGSAEELADVLLVDNEMIGVIRLSDVADITVIDNADESYATLNGDDGIVLMIYKSSASGTNAVSTACNEALEDLAAEDANFEYMVLMDQGSYIDMIVESVLMSILMGGMLAIIILALFLKDIKPTLVVAVSIPLSVLLALVLMYFTGLELNVMTLSGLALGIGMLVDNSIVVLENILRLRNSGLSAPHAAVQGARQVRSSIIASTLTTICVFLPVVFTDGTVRTLLVPLALTIGYCLVASLAIALTVVPAATSTIFRDIKPKQYKLMDRIQDKYEVSLRWCLKHKAAPLTVAIGLFVVTVYAITQMGIIFFPDITTNSVQVTITTPETDTREEAYAKVGEIAEIILEVDGVQDVGVMSSSSTSSLMGVSISSSDSSYDSYICYVTIPDDASQKEAQAICDAITESTAHIDAEIEAESSGMSDMTSLLSSSGLTVNIYGTDLDTLQEISADVQEIVTSVEGFDTPTDGTEENEASLHLVIDKDKAMSYGLTVAQVYSDVATALTTSYVSTTIWVDSVELDVEVVDETDLLTVENLMNLEFDVSSSTTETTDYSSYDLSALTGDSDEEDGDAEDEEDGEEDEEEDVDTITLADIATLETTTAMSQISRENQTRFLSVTADVLDGYNTTLLTRELSPLLEDYEDTLPYGYSIEIGGESSQISEMLTQIIEMAILGFLFIYLIMVAEFQSLKSPFIVIFTIPLAFTGGMIGLLIAGEQLSVLSLIGFIVLMGTVVNNGIVFVDYTNQLRLGGLGRHDALCAAGRTRMRPIIMTALTTILALSRMIFGTDMASQLGSGMSIVIAGGLLYATFMTLYIIPVIYDIFFKSKPLNIDTGDDLEEIPDDAAEYLRLHGATAEGADAEGKA